MDARISEWYQFCARQGGKVGVKIISVGMGTKPMSKSVDKRYLTPMAAGTKYLDVVVNGVLVRGMYDTGSNVTMMTKKLAKEIGVPTLPYSAKFRQANG